MKDKKRQIGKSSVPNSVKESCRWRRSFLRCGTIRVLLIENAKEWFDFCWRTSLCTKGTTSLSKCASKAVRCTP